VDHGQQPLDCLDFDANGACCQAAVVPGNLDFDGFQYEIAPGKLLFNFFATGGHPFNIPNTMSDIETVLGLFPLDQDFTIANTDPVITNLNIIVWNENETGLTGMRRCLTCWEGVLLSELGGFFVRPGLQTDRGYARLDGTRHPDCDVWEQPFPGQPPVLIAESIATPLLGVAGKLIDITPAGGATIKEAAGSALHGSHRESATLMFTPTGGGGGGEKSGTGENAVPEQAPTPETPQTNRAVK
jgi:hypothetical protein